MKKQQISSNNIFYLAKDSFLNNERIWILLSNLYNLDSNKITMKEFPKNKIISLSKDEQTLWFNLEKFFTRIFMYNTNYNFFSFLKAYAKYFSQERDYDQEWEITKLYWKFIDTLKNERINFNKYLITINRHLFEVQKGFKK